MKTAYHVIKNDNHRAHKCNTRRRATQLVGEIEKNGHTARIIPEKRSISEEELLRRYVVK